MLEIFFINLTTSIKQKQEQQQKLSEYRQDWQHGQDLSHSRAKRRYFKPWILIQVLAQLATMHKNQPLQDMAKIDATLARRDIKALAE